MPDAAEAGLILLASGRREPIDEASGDEAFTLDERLAA